VIENIVTKDRFLVVSLQFFLKRFDHTDS